ncbi:hypothetical protein LCGC14_3022160, partial [marine sediment metagenome]
VSPGCKFCYAERITERWGQKFNEIKLPPDRLDQPLKWKKPRRIFVCSMSDLFNEEIPDDFIGRCFVAIAQAQQHTYQVLTKRPERMSRYLSDDPLVLVKRWALAGDRSITMDNPDELFSESVESYCSNRWSCAGVGLGTRKAWGYPLNVFPLPNVWLGASCENQPTLDARLPSLRSAPAAVRFLSLEPLLGPIHLPDTNGDIDLVIVGGESGPGARPCWLDSIRTIVASCAATRTSVFVKQLGARPYQIGESPEPECNCREFDCEHRSQIPPVKWLKLKSRKGSDPAEWPADLRIQEMPK